MRSFFKSSLFGACSLVFFIGFCHAITPRRYGYPRYQGRRSYDSRASPNRIPTSRFLPPNPSSRSRQFSRTPKVYGYGGLPQYLKRARIAGRTLEQPQTQPQRALRPGRGYPAPRSSYSAYAAPRSLVPNSRLPSRSAYEGLGARSNYGGSAGHGGSAGYGSAPGPVFPGFNGKYAPIGGPTKNPALGLPFQYGLYTYGDLGGFAYGYRPYYVGYNYQLPTPFGEYPTEESYPGFPDIVHPERHEEEEEEHEVEHEASYERPSYGQSSYGQPSYGESSYSQPSYSYQEPSSYIVEGEEGESGNVEEPQPGNEQSSGQEQQVQERRPL